MSPRLARAFLALYPLAFRRRYGQEMEALIADSRPGVRATLDLIAGAAVMALAAALASLATVRGWRAARLGAARA